MLAMERLFRPDRRRPDVRVLIMAEHVLSVLIADDDPLIRDACRLVLQERGHCVRVAGDGTEALEMLADIYNWFTGRLRHR